MIDDPSFVPSFTMNETPLETDSAGVCEGPLCSKAIQRTGIIYSRRFCSDACKLNAWAIRKVSKLLEAVTDEQVLEILHR